jgi:dihydropteroate synthase
MLTLEDLAALVEQHKPALNARVREFEIGGRPFSFNARPHLMGVINLSPDSWYRESVCLTSEQAVRRGKTLHAQGADIVDIGAESTLAHASRADSAVQSARLLPVIAELRTAGVLVSVETYNADVTRECLKSGANILNWTGTDEPERFFELAAEYQAAVIVCYVQGKNVRDVGDFNFKADPISQMEKYFESQIKAETKVGLE